MSLRLLVAVGCLPHGWLKLNCGHSHSILVSLFCFCVCGTTLRCCPDYVHHHHRLPEDVCAVLPVQAQGQNRVSIQLHHDHAVCRPHEVSVQPITDLPLVLLSPGLRKTLANQWPSIACLYVPVVPTFAIIMNLHNLHPHKML